MSEFLTYGSVGGVGRKPGPYPAANAGSASRLQSGAIGPAWLRSSLSVNPTRYLLPVLLIGLTGCASQRIDRSRFDTLTARHGLGHVYNYYSGQRAITTILLPNIWVAHLPLSFAGISPHPHEYVSQDVRPRSMDCLAGESNRWNGEDFRANTCRSCESDTFPG